MSKGREAILGTIRKALAEGRAAGWTPTGDTLHAQAPFAARTIEAEESETRQMRFSERLARLGDSVRRIHAASLATHLEDIARERGLNRGVAEAEALEFLPPQATEAFDTTLRKDTLFAADHALVLADYAVAETGTLAFFHTPGRSRLLTIAPPLQLIVLPASRLLPDLVDLLERMKAVPPEHAVLWVTGSSRTADIDGILVRGAHGPKELIILLLMDR